MFQKDNFSLINNNLLSNENNNFLINQYKDKIIEEANNKISINSFKNNIISFGNGNKINLNFHQIKYGIDENGNPINIKEYYKSINDSVNLNSNSSMQSGISNFAQKLKKPIAYITKDENNNNILVDLKGNKITTKNKEGDYDFNLQLHVIIKDFDVKHPELRINGERNYNNENIEEINEKPSENIKDKNKKKEKGFSSTTNNKTDNLSNINLNFNYNNENNDLMAGSCFSSSVRNDIDKIIFRINTDNYNNIGKYSNIIGKNSRNNKFVLRTKNILTNNNTNVFQNNISGKNVNFALEKESKSMNKNKNQMNPIKRSNTVNSNYINFKNQMDINNKKEDTKNKKKAIKLLLINNYNSKINKENNKKVNQINRNKLDIHLSKLKSDIKIKKNVNCPRKIKSEQNTIKKNISHNFYNNKKLATSTTLFDNNIINKSIKFSQNYFAMKHKKNFSNSKLIKKNYKRQKKKMNFIQINDKNNSSTKSNNIIDDKKDNKNSNIGSNVINKITKRKILKKDLSQKSKKIEIQKKEKILNLQNMLKKNKNFHMYILSEEANNMIRSFSKNNIAKENQLNTSIKKLHTSQLNFKKTKMIPVSKESSNINNSLNLDNTYFSPTKRNSETNFQNIQKIPKYDSNKINKQNYVGITLSLLNNENKKLKGNTNNQININFTPYQIQCESLVKNNGQNQHQRVYYNNSEKKNPKSINKYNMNHLQKNFLSPKYQIYL